MRCDGLPILQMKGVGPWVLGSKLRAVIEGIGAAEDGGKDGDGLPDDRVPGVSAHWARGEEWGGDVEPGELDGTALAPA